MPIQPASTPTGTASSQGNRKATAATPSQDQPGHQQHPRLGRPQHAVVGHGGADRAAQAEGAGGGPTGAARARAPGADAAALATGPGTLGRTRLRLASTISVAFSRSCLVHGRPSARAKRLVLDGHVQLVVGPEAGDVQVGRAHARPAIVGDRALGVQHAAVPLEHPHARFQQRPVAGAGQRPQHRDVAGPGDQQAHVHAIAGGRTQRLHVGGDAHEVGVGQPQPLAAPARRSADPVGTGPPGWAWWPPPAPARRPPGRSAWAWASSSSGMGAPVLAQTRANASSRSATDGPRISMPVSRQGSMPASGIAQPAGADTQAADEADLAVDGDGLAVIARHPAERAVQLGRVEAADLGAGGAAAATTAGGRPRCPASRTAPGPSRRRGPWPPGHRRTDGPPGRR